VPAVVHRRHVGGALHVFQPRLMAQLGTRVPAHPARDAMRALDDGVADVQPQALFPRTLRHGSLDDGGHRFLVFLCQQRFDRVLQSQLWTEGSARDAICDNDMQSG